MARKGTVVGLDVGRHAVKAAWAEFRGEQPTVVRAESIRLSSTQGDGAGVVAQWVAGMGLAKHPCVLGLPGDKAMFQPFMLPANDPRTLEQAAAIEVLKFNEMASESMIYGFAPITMNPGERRLILSMARHAVVQEILAYGRGMGLDIIDIVPSPIALINALEACSEKHESPNLYINIGAAATEVAIGSSTGILFARAFPYGGQMFTDALTRANQLSISQAENLKLTEGFVAGKTEPPTPLNQVADTWLSELQACMSVYQSLYPGRRTFPSHAVFVGGGSLLKGLPEYMISKLSMEPAKCEILPGNVKHDNAGVFTVAAGLALAGLKEGLFEISLLPPEARDKMTFRRQKPFWIASGIAAGLIFSVSTAGGYYDYLRMEKHLGAQRASLSARQNLVDEIEITKARNEQIGAMAQPVKNLVRGAPVIRELMDTLAASKTTGDSITMICDAELYFSVLLPTTPQKTGMRDRRRSAAKEMERKPDIGLQRIFIEGYTRTANLSTVKDMINKLQAAAFVASADLLNDDEMLMGSRVDCRTDGRRFVIDVRLKVGAQ